MSESTNQPTNQSISIRLIEVVSGSTMPPPLDKIFVTPMLTRDLFVVANIVVLL